MVIMMEESFESPTDQTKMAAALLVACVVQTLGESDATMQRRFLERLENVYHDVRDRMGTDCLETLKWVREILQSGDLPSLPDS